MAMHNNVVSGDGAETEALSILDVIPVVRFPHIWKMILADADTLLSWQNAVSLEDDHDQEWKRILDPKRKLWFFRKILPFLPSHLERNDVLKLRLACRHWSEGVDKFIEDTAHDDHHKRTDPQYMKRAFLWKYNDYYHPYTLFGADTGSDDDEEFTSLNVDAFIKSMGDHPRNPIVGRGLVIHDQNDDDLPPVQLLEQIGRFVPLFGHHLHYLHLTLLSRSSIQEVTGLLTSALRETPNLRQLRLTLLDVELEDPGNEMDEIEIPHMIQLRTLQLHYSPCRRQGRRQTGQLTLVPDLIRRHSPQLQRFDVRGLAPSFWIPLDWQDLRELNLKMDSHESLHNLLKMEAPRLTRLHLENYYYRERGLITMQDYQQVLDHFPNLEPTGMVFHQTI